MNIYLISQNENTDYNTYDSAIVYAKDEEEARNIHPSGDIIELVNGVKWDPWKERGSWCSSPDKVDVVLIGWTNNLITSGLILASYNAG